MSEYKLHLAHHHRRNGTNCMWHVYYCVGEGGVKLSKQRLAQGSLGTSNAPEEKRILLALVSGEDVDVGCRRGEKFTHHVCR